MVVLNSCFCIGYYCCWCLAILDRSCDETFSDPSKGFFYDRQATQLIEKIFGVVGLRYRVITEIEIATPSKSCSGVGTHLTPTKKKRKITGKATSYAAHNHCYACKIWTTTHICTACRDNGDKNVWLYHTGKKETLFNQLLRNVHGW